MATTIRDVIFGQLESFVSFCFQVYLLFMEITQHKSSKKYRQQIMILKLKYGKMKFLRLRRDLLKD